MPISETPDDKKDTATVITVAKKPKFEPDLLKGVMRAFPPLAVVILPFMAIQGIARLIANRFKKNAIEKGRVPEGLEVKKDSAAQTPSYPSDSKEAQQIIDGLAKLIETQSKILALQASQASENTKPAADRPQQAKQHKSSRAAYKEGYAMGLLSSAPSTPTKEPTASNTPKPRPS